MWDAIREHVADRYFQRNREDVEPSKHVFAGWAARTRDSAEVVAVQVDQVEDSFFIQLVRIVELTGDDPPAIRQRVDESIYEGEFKEGEFFGQGKMTWNDGGWYEGEWLNGDMHGRGREVRADGSLRHEGEWLKGQPIRNKK